MEVSTCDTYLLIGNGSLQYHSDGPGSDPSLNQYGWKYERGKKDAMVFLTPRVDSYLGFFVCRTLIGFGHDEQVRRYLARYKWL
jgi:hypothetical protein